MQEQKRLFSSAGLSINETRPPLQVSGNMGTFGLGFQTLTQQPGKYKKVQHQPLKWTPTVIPQWFSHFEKQPDRKSFALDVKQLKGTLFTTKNKMNGIDPRSIRDARNKCNPFEAIQSEGFQNRAALKLAEIDACTQWAVTQPRSLQRIDRPKHMSTLHALDLCGGPGGFSEYIIWRTQQRCQVVGATLCGPLDFNLSRLPTSCFRAHYGVDHTGNILYPPNQKSLIVEARRHTQGFGVDVVVADGGFSVKGRENEQEELSIDLMMCQGEVALGSLAFGGVFVCKLFDIFTSVMQQWLHAMSFYFERITLLKPNQSRPANSERYFIGYGFRRNTGHFPLLYQPFSHEPWLIQHSLKWRQHKSQTFFDLYEDTSSPFRHFVEHHIKEVAERQILHLERLFTYLEDPSQEPFKKQEFVRIQCLKAWYIPLKQ